MLEGEKSKFFYEYVFKINEIFIQTSLFDIDRSSESSNSKILFYNFINIISRIF